MIVWMCTDMEGLAGIDRWEQCYDPDDHAAVYRYGREQLTAEVNAAVAGCFDAGATEVRVLDGHGRNQNRGFIVEKLDPRVHKMWIASRRPIRWEGLDASVLALVVIGQHAMAGTINGFLDHTQAPKTLCRFRIKGQEHGELSQIALYAGACGVPLAYASGDEALCVEARRLFPQVTTTATKRGTGWATCDLYPPDEVRKQIRVDIAAALRGAAKLKPWTLPMPVTVEIEWAWSEIADGVAKSPGVERVDARTARWKAYDGRDIYDVPALQPGINNAP